MISVSQQNFATVLKTVVTAVSNRRYVFPHNLIANVATVSKPSQTCFFKKKINLKPFLLTFKKIKNHFDGILKNF
jgi:hypothetical protein